MHAALAFCTVLMILPLFLLFVAGAARAHTRFSLPWQSGNVISHEWQPLQDHGTVDAPFKLCVPLGSEWSDIPPSSQVEIDCTWSSVQTVRVGAAFVNWPLYRQVELGDNISPLLSSVDTRRVRLSATVNAMPDADTVVCLSVLQSTGQISCDMTTLALTVTDTPTSDADVQVDTILTVLPDDKDSTVTGNVDAILIVSSGAGQGADVRLSDKDVYYDEDADPPTD